MSNTTYDLEQSFIRFEEDLIQDIIDRIQSNTKGDILAKGDYKGWKKDQLKALHDFKTRNKQHFTKKSKRHLNKMIEDALNESYIAGGAYTKREIENAIKKGLRTKKTPSEDMTAGFTGVNDRKLNSLMSETKKCIYKAEYSAFRYTEDIYRKVIFDAQVYFNTGTGTLAQAIDMATKDFLSRGVDCIEYKDGRRVNIQSYSEMVLRTSNKRSYMQGEAAMRDEYGLNLVIVTRRNNGCPKCMNYTGKIFVDDVYSETGSAGKLDDDPKGKTKGKTESTGKYPLLSTAIANGLYHPNCRDSHSTYFEGITTTYPEPTDAEKAEAQRIYDLEQQQRYNERQIRKYDRLEKGSIDEENKTKYGNLKKEWKNRNKEFVNEHEELRRRYDREKYVGPTDPPSKKTTTPKSSTPKSPTTPKTTTPKTTTPKTPTTNTPKTTVPASPAESITKTTTPSKPLTDKEKAFKTFADNGITVKGQALSKMNEKDLLAVSNRMGELKNKYGVNVTVSGRSNPKSITAAATRYSNRTLKDTEIRFNTAIKDLDKSAQENMKYKWWSNSTPELRKLHSTDHEYGHSVQLSIINDRLNNKGISDAFITHDMIDNEVKLIKTEIVDMFKQNNPDEDYIKYISGYGKTDPSEFFAEAFAGANGGMPNKLELYIDEWIKKEGYLK